MIQALGSLLIIATEEFTLVRRGLWAARKAQQITEITDSIKKALNLPPSTEETKEELNEDIFLYIQTYAQFQRVADACSLECPSPSSVYRLWKHAIQSKDYSLSSESTSSKFFSYLERLPFAIQVVNGEVLNFLIQLSKLIAASDQELTMLPGNYLSLTLGNPSILDALAKPLFYDTSEREGFAIVRQVVMEVVASAKYTKLASTSALSTDTFIGYLISCVGKHASSPDLNFFDFGMMYPPLIATTTANPARSLRARHYTAKPITIMLRNAAERTYSNSLGYETRRDIIGNDPIVESASIRGTNPESNKDEYGYHVVTPSPTSRKRK